MEKGESQHTVEVWEANQQRNAQRGDGGHQILGEREVGVRSKTGLGADREKGAKRGGGGCV